MKTHLPSQISLIPKKKLAPGALVLAAIAGFLVAPFAGQPNRGVAVVTLGLEGQLQVRSPVANPNQPAAYFDGPQLFQASASLSNPFASWTMMGPHPAFGQSSAAHSDPGRLGAEIPGGLSPVFFASLHQFNASLGMPNGAFLSEAWMNQPKPTDALASFAMADYNRLNLWTHDSVPRLAPSVNAGQIGVDSL